MKTKLDLPKRKINAIITKNKTTLHCSETSHTNWSPHEERRETEKDKKVTIIKSIKFKYKGYIYSFLLSFCKRLYKLVIITVYWWVCNRDGPKKYENNDKSREGVELYRNKAPVLRCIQVSTDVK